MKRVKVQTNLAVEFSDPKTQKEVVELLSKTKKWLLTPSVERSDIRTLIFELEDALTLLTRKEKWVTVPYEFRIQFNPGLGYSEIVIEGKKKGVFDRPTGINNVAFGKGDYFQDMIKLYRKYYRQDEGSVISGAGVVNNQNGQILCGQICQGSTTNERYFKEACEIIKKHTSYDPEILPGYMP